MDLENSLKLEKNIEFEKKWILKKVRQNWTKVHRI